MTDLQIFASQFDCTYLKPVKEGLEVRVNNLDAGKHDAQQFIKRNGLNLEVSTVGSMVSLKAFLVRPKP